MATDHKEVIPCGLVVSKQSATAGVPFGDLPFNERRGLIRNVGGRVTRRTATIQPG